MPWQKGVSGNPKGRPRKSVQVSELARRESPGAFKRIIKIAKGLPVRDDGDKPSISEIRRANEYILDRHLGKPTADESRRLGPLGGADMVVIDTGVSLITFGRNPADGHEVTDLEEPLTIDSTATATDSEDDNGCS